MEMDEEELQLVEVGMKTTTISEGKILAEDQPDEEEEEAPMRIVTNWKRPEDPTKMVLSLIIGELVPVNEMAEHMRISLIDLSTRNRRNG